MNYINDDFTYEHPRQYDERLKKPLDQYIYGLWKPILIQSINKFIKEGMTVCDLGCGTFEHLQYMQKAGKIYAVDINKKMIEVGLGKIKNFIKKIIILNEDVTSTSIPNGSCDVVWSVGVTEFVEVDKLFFEMKRICKKNGMILIQFPNVFNPYNLTAKIIYKLLKKPIKQYRSIYEFKKLTKKYNLELKEFVSTGLFSPCFESFQKYFIWAWKILNFLYSPFQKVFPLGANVFCIIINK